MKPSPKPRRAKILARGRKLGNRKRGRPKKAATATAAERKNKKSQSALDLLHAKTLSAAPAQGQTLIIIFIYNELIYIQTNMLRTHLLSLFTYEKSPNNTRKQCIKAFINEYVYFLLVTSKFYHL